MTKKPVPVAHTARAIERTIVALLQRRQPKTACPSEVARLLDGQSWRERMPAVREAARRLAQRGHIDVLQRGKKIELKNARGPIRLMLSAATAAGAVRPKKR